MHVLSPLFEECGVEADVADVEDFANTLIMGGFHDRDGVVWLVQDHFEGQLSDEEADTLVTHLWQERLAEQAGWPEQTDADRLLAVFDTLDANGIVARAHFTCCNSCGVSEIGGEAKEDARGYVFFHQQDTEGAVAGMGMYLSYGTFGDGDATGIGHEVVAALAAANLPTEWDGSDARRIKVSPLDWQLRLDG